MSKNKLQEYFQAKNQPLPVYETLKIGGSDHKPIFWSTVTLFEGEIFSEEGTSKSQAEKNVALSAYTSLLKTQLTSTELDLIKSINSPANFVSEIKSNIYVLVDLDNLDIKAEIINAYSSVNFYIFVSKIITKNFNTLSPYANVKIYQTQTVITDGADHYLSFICGQLCYQLLDPKAKFIIYTRDHFGEATASFCCGLHVCNQKSLLEALQQI